MFTLISNIVACVRTFLRGKPYKGNYYIFINFENIQYLVCYHVYILHKTNQGL